MKKLDIIEYLLFGGALFLAFFEIPGYGWFLGAGMIILLAEGYEYVVNKCFSVAEEETEKDKENP